MIARAFRTPGLFVAVLSFSAFAADPAPTLKPDKLPGGRLDLFDAKTRRVEMVVFYEGLTHETSGDNRFQKPKVLLLDEKGGAISELIKDPMAQIEGTTALHTAANDVFRVENAKSRFRQVPVSSGDADPVPGGEPILIDADTLTVEAAKRSAVYERRVRIRQGALEVDCDRLEVAWDASGKGLLWARATGQPASGQPNAGEPVLARLPGQGTARAPEIRIDFRTSRVEAPQGGIAELRSTSAPLSLDGGKR